MNLPLYAEPNIAVIARPDGSFVLRSNDELLPYASHLGELLAQQAQSRPDKVFLAERDNNGSWRELTYAQAWTKARSIGAALLERGCDATNTVAVLSANGIDHALMVLGSFLSGVPVTQVSTAYSLMSNDFSKLRHVLAKAKPRVVFVADPEPFANALTSESIPSDALIVTSTGANNTTPIASLLATEPGAQLDAAYNAIGPDTIGKYLFTSGSTGTPKGVPNTHRMMCSNQQAIAQCWPFITERPPVLVDWLPWSHTFGGNYCFNLVLSTGGTMYIDAGKPAPALMPITVKNLTDVSPTVYFNVPAGYGALASYLESDDALAASFFSRLEILFYAAAALPLDTWNRLLAVAQRVGRVPMMTSAWGSTETAPLATLAHFPISGPGNIGVPIPGVEIKFVPSGAKQELRVRGPNIMKGYLNEPALSEAAFDEEGFYRMGDAGRFVDQGNPTAGIVFDGRTAEDFKLTSGTWVSVTTVRTGLVTALAPFVADAVIAGHDRDELTALIFLGAAANGVHDLDAQLATKLAEYNRTAGGSSMRIARIAVQHEPPQIDGNEVTDKGYINQRAVLERRKNVVDGLYATPSQTSPTSPTSPN